MKAPPSGAELEEWGKMTSPRMERLIAEIRALREAGWRPIETAPKDGTPILVFLPKDGRQLVREVRWSIPFEGSANGYWAASWTGSTILPEGPTHWMPMPLPPA